jgi:hypothetical protein
MLSQANQKNNPDSRISVHETGSGPLLSQYAISLQGLSPADFPRYGRFFWEGNRSADFVRWQSTIDETEYYGGRELMLWFGPDLRSAIDRGDAYVRGEAGWGKQGVVVRQMRHLPVTIFTGEVFDTNAAIIVPHNQGHLAAIWAFCSSEEYLTSIRRIDRKLNVTNATLVKVPFDLDRWKLVSEEKYPKGLPEPYSDDPTQWLFHGHPQYAEPGTELHVALARLAGYLWPAEADPGLRLSGEARTRIAEAAALPAADADGLLTLVPVLGKRPLAERLRAYCSAAWGNAWTHGTEAALITSACDRVKDKPPKQLTLEAWLPTHAARQHTKLFQERPFLWWITDGRNDGFTAIVHYHRLTSANLERLAYHVLGNWTTDLGTDPRAEAARVLQAKLTRILDGETPYDIFVRWKPLARQPLGWDPDLDDGVRLANVPNVRYGVDRGKDAASTPWFPTFNGERRNDHHTTLEQKNAARATAAA